MADLIQQIYHRLGEAWLKAPPEPIPTEVQLAERFQVSRTTIRGALSLFEKKGLLSGKGRRRHFVRKLSKSDLEEVKAKPTSKVESVQEALMEKIARGEFKSHQMISELELSKHFEVTTGTVREALLKLSPLHLFHKENRQRWKVVELNEQMISELIEFRKILELKVLRSCMELEQEHVIWKLLQENLESQREEVSTKNIQAEKWIALDRDFHQILAKGGGNIYISEALKNVGLLMHLQRKAIKFDQKQVQLSMRDHQNLYSALRENRAEKVDEIFLNHMKLAKNRLMALVK